MIRMSMYGATLRASHHVFDIVMIKYHALCPTRMHLSWTAFGTNTPSNHTLRSQLKSRQTDMRMMHGYIRTQIAVVLSKRRGGSTLDGKRESGVRSSIDGSSACELFRGSPQPIRFRHDLRRSPGIFNEGSYGRSVYVSGVKSTSGPHYYMHTDHIPGAGQQRAQQRVLHVHKAFNRQRDATMMRRY